MNGLRSTPDSGAAVGPSPADSALPPHATGFLSWSGGKDSALALSEILSRGFQVRTLLTMMVPRVARSRSHGLRRQILRAQSRAIGIPVQMVAAHWSGYEEAFQVTARSMAADGLRFGASGDLDHVGSRGWMEESCRNAGLIPLLPLQGRSRGELLERFLHSGLSARVIAAREGVLPEARVGEPLTPELIREVEDRGFDPLGEDGSYHTVVTDGPMFRNPIPLRLGLLERRSGVLFRDASLADNPS
jgi:diphthine-ammonia ligase